MQPQNLLVVMSDEHNPTMLGCAGHALVQTPHLDRLASRGTRFSAAYAVCPICVPAGESGTENANRKPGGREEVMRDLITTQNDTPVPTEVEAKL